jgi:hypothetical protein
MTSDATAIDTPASLEAAVIPSGGGFRAVLRRGDEIAWRCPHVHFTDHSAKACAARELARVQPAATKAAETAG